ncbi:uncharacterized protein ACHE_80538S [Aspergillus chevalieri]|uniref:C3HC zinc finger domain protein n=1 Tax=Aspergillus chevalieri TaxID=182096 RepID=A0A7R7VXL1_ASPCH|nr:uncharacterized protein ACHE_80538S [Aspergillus chevalieri]BCR92638.1 hypothetical protein ACHE_80538S [Aspergillus chevalieri]
MSYALETKKRKFHRVLESLTKPSIPDQPAKESTTTGAPTTARDAIKKIRLSKDDNSSSTSSIKNSMLKVARPGTRASSVSSTARPSFVPWDRERFLERLETFRRVDRWSPKPTAVSEVAWAKQGWICTDVSRVTCVGGCGGSVVVKLPDELDELDGYDAEKVQERKDVRARLVEEYTKRLVEGHGENCPWRNKGCDATIHRLPLSNPDVAISGLQKRYLNLVKMEDKLPVEEAIQTPESLDLDEIINILPTGFVEPDKPSETIEPEKQPETTQPETPKPETKEGEKQKSAPQTQEEISQKITINKAAFALALFGWDTVSDGAAGLAACGACFRRLGLWMYKPKYGDTELDTQLEVAGEHMEYCPWVSGKAQSGTGKPTDKPETLRSGWQVSTQALKVKHRRQIRSTASMDTLRAGSETPSMMDGSVVDSEVDEETKKATDREWWSKIRRMRQVLNVNFPRKSTPGH